MHVGETRGPHALAALAGAVVIGAIFVGGQYDVDLPGALNELWYSSARLVAALAAALAAAVYVGRWWTLNLALLPLAAGLLLEVSGHSTPWSEAFPPLWAAAVWCALLLLTLSGGVTIAKLVARARR